MSQSVATPPVAPSRQMSTCPTVWGLSARELFEAYWRAHGVRCVWRGQPQALSRADELYLLTEPRQLALFDIGQVIDQLIWRGATVIRLRIVEQESEMYAERVVTDERGFVQRIERQYRPGSRGSCRVLLTPSRRVCRKWMAASDHREGWTNIRRSVGWSRVDCVRCPGRCFTDGDADQERALISRLVSCWPDPGQAIAGIAQADEGIWTFAGESAAEDAVLVGPLWLGIRDSLEVGTCLVGPTWIEDQSPETWGRGKATVRDIRDVEPADAPKSGTTSGEKDSGYVLAKRTFDIIVSLVALLMFLPLFAVVALCIVIEDGRPVFYRHVRQGQNGRLFRCLKFRTMYRNSDILTEELAAKNRADGPQVFIEHDTRVTRVGHILRHLQIDEFPQFWNVLLGQMSVVGPRPSPDNENQFCPAWREIRLSVRPGITGLWQLKRTRARGEDFQEWIKYDIEYVRRASFWLDLSIILRTGWVMITGRRRSCV